MIRHSRFLLTAVLLAFSIAASAQSIFLSTNQLNFSAPAGASSSVQTLNIQSDVGPLPFSIKFTPLNGGNWFISNQVNGSLPVNILVAGDATRLAPGIYTGTLTVTVAAATNSPMDVPVTFAVGTYGTNTLSTTPSAMTFSAQAGGANPPAQTLLVDGLAGQVDFVALPAVNNGAGWLQVSPASGTATTSLLISTITQGMSVGTYYGSVTISPNFGPPVVVPITLSVGTTSTVTVSNSTLNFYYQSGGTYPVSQNLQFTTDSAPVSFNLTPTVKTGNWLSVTPLIANTPRSVTVSVSPNALPAGTYTGNIAVGVPNGAATIQNIAVTLVISAGPLLTVSTAPAPFNYQTGGALPLSQSVQLGSTAGSLGFGVTAATNSGNWLLVGPIGGNTPATITIGVNPVNLQSGTYTGVVTITAPGASNPPQSFGVTLNVNTATSVTPLPSSLNFNYQINGTLPISQSILLTTSGGSSLVNIVASTSTCGNWLNVYPAVITAPGGVNVTVNTTGFTLPQTCTGQISFSGSGIAGTITVPVTLTASNSPLLNVSPGSLSFTIPYNGSNSDPQTIALSSTDGSRLSFTATTAAVGGGSTSWLNVGPLFGSTPANLSVIINPYLLNPGTYRGGVTISSPGLLAPVTVPVSVTVSSATVAAASPAALSFTQATGGAAPPAQSLALSTQSGSFPFTITTATSGGINWMKVSQTSGSSPQTISVSANAAGLSPGSYSGSISIAIAGASNNPLVVPITFTVVSGQGITAAPTQLNFTYGAGTGNIPVPQIVTVTGTTGAVPFTAAASTNLGGTWLSVTPGTASTPANLSVAVSPTTLPAGTYTGQVSLTPSGASSVTIQILVTLTIQPTAAPSIASVTNAASGVKGAIAPGEIVTIKGSVLGPLNGQQFTLDGTGHVPTNVYGTRVLFDNYPAPVLYTSAGQVNAIVPYEIAGRQVVQVQVEYQGVGSLSVSANVLSAAPAIFTNDSSGSGQGAVLNQDYSYNSASNPAAVGSIIQVFGTGEGQTNPVGSSGSVAAAVLPKPVMEVTATVDGVQAAVVYAGAAPQSVAGLMQVNVVVPTGASSRPDAEVIISVGGVPSQKGVTVAIRQ